MSTRLTTSGFGKSCRKLWTTFRSTLSRLRDNLCEGREQAATMVGEIEEVRKKLARLKAEQTRTIRERGSP
jgi:hypothetical protein